MGGYPPRYQSGLPPGVTPRGGGGNNQNFMNPQVMQGYSQNNNNNNQMKEVRKLFSKF